MPVEVDADNLKQGLLGLVIALVEIISEVLKAQAIKRITGGRLSDESIERLGQGIMDIEETIERIKQEQGLEQSVSDIRNQLDDVIDQILDTIVIPIDTNNPI
ncbi:gas vesicle protein GvpK [Hydrogenispora ethanolica]|jgi:hypothetical protein|uniref:Gas vesicle protein GvpK n=1 Tax=Hydrogenispora ethanolica TaxID=1082276 RepID=A0A4R1QTG1_HYDET|nr:gas vesicle protein K [Hydrogenispora ethanolica]TCL56797.1 gas vesicle protein GvpK [Hydrogenispora ethanolica]